MNKLMPSKKTMLPFHVFPGLTHVAIWALLATGLFATSRAEAQSVVGDLSSTITALNFFNPGYYYAQEFTITSGTWDITQAQIAFNASGLPGDPLVQVRNSVTSPNNPGSSVLGSFTLNPGSIPTSGTGTATALANGTFTLAAGTYWLYIGNNQSGGGGIVPFASGTLVQSGSGGNVITAESQTDGGSAFGGPLNYAMVFELDGEQAVPEPTTLALTVLGSAAFIVFRHRVKVVYRHSPPASEFVV